jgi:hypothetical protein
LFRLTYRNTKYAPTDEWRKITEDEAESVARSTRLARPAENRKAVPENAEFR